MLVLASSAAAFLSSYVWGRFADRSSRRVLQVAGLLGALSLCAAVVLSLSGVASNPWALALVLFVLMIAYHGVRQARSTYLVDMSPENARARYTAVANTAIGLVLIGSGAFSALVAVIGVEWTIGLFAAMCIAAAVVAQGLEEVEG